jgi:uncharacterized protein (TIGR02246 family)
MLVRRKALLVSVVTLFVLAYSPIASIADERSSPTDREHLEARQVAQSVVESYINAYDKHDPKAISMLFVPDGVFLPPNGSPVVQGRDAIERSWADLFKNIGGHETITVKDAIPAGNDAVLAITEFKIIGDAQNAGKTISGRASIALAKTSDGWRYVSIAPQTQPPPSATAGSPQEAGQVAESVVNSFMAAYNAHDPKAISALFLPDAMLLGFDGAVTQGREAIERVYAGLLKNQGGHFSVVIKDANSLGDNVVVANDELEIRDVGQNHDTIHGRAVITLAKTPDGWRYAAISAQKLPPGATTGSRQ